MSRPRKTEAEKLSKQIVFRVKGEVYERLQAQASLAGLSANQLARNLTCQQSGELKIKAYKKIDPIFVKQLEKLAINVNQLAKNSHIFKRVTPDLDSLSRRIESIIDQAVEDEVGK